jgi:hypothetical protein
MNIGDKVGPKLILALVYIVVALQVAALEIYMQIDNVVNVELYSYGLQFSAIWAGDYWLNFRMVIGFLSFAFVIMGLALVPYYLYSRHDTLALRRVCVLFPLISAGLVAISLYFIIQIDYIVNYTLYNCGLQLSQVWAEKYLLITRSSLAMLETSVVVQIVISIFTWNLMKD